MSISHAEITYRVPYADTDQMAVVYHSNFFVYFERCRTEILRNLGYTYREMEADGILLPVIHAECDYQKPAHYDDLLTITGSFRAIGGTRIQADCQVTRDGTVLAVGHTVHVCMDAATRRPRRLPPAWLEQL